MILSPTELAEVEDALEGLAEIVAEDANEAAMFGDGPCGSHDRLLAYNAAQRKLRAHFAAVSEMEADKRVAICADDIPF